MKNKDRKRCSLFEDLNAENSFTELESLCMNCHEQGISRLLLTKVPFFKEIILMAFSCPHCGWRSNEVQYGGSFSEKGVLYELFVKCKEDLNRQIVKSDSALIRIPELEFEIPPNTQRGLLNTIEGFLVQSIDALKQNQEERRAIDPEATAKIDEFISRLESCSRGEMPFTFIVEDPAGNSFIENPSAPLPDPNLKVVYFTRTPEQNLSIGLITDSSPEEEVLKSWNSKANDGF